MEILTDLPIMSTDLPLRSTEPPIPTTNLPVSTTEEEWAPFPAGDVLNDPWFKKINFCFHCYSETKLVSTSLNALIKMIVHIW